jgi:uncharacterized membrane protein YgdD (TMEM256/DUF423 family)
MIWIKLGAMFMFFGVALGAFGAHALKGKVDAYYLDVFKTGVLYQMVHALGLFVVAWLSTLVQDPRISWAGILMVTGILFFSGSFYIICFSGVRAFGAITPLGGLCLLAAWGLLFATKI